MGLLPSYRPLFSLLTPSQTLDIQISTLSTRGSTTEDTLDRGSWNGRRICVMEFANLLNDCSRLWSSRVQSWQFYARNSVSVRHRSDRMPRFADTSTILPPWFREAKLDCREWRGNRDFDVFDLFVQREIVMWKKQMVRGRRRQQVSWHVWAVFQSGPSSWRSS